ncbi:MAG: hypothetical protein J6M17_00780 [Ruminococcus sp.]|nr:hypothetical protein [Ruminococcus sp.]
MKERLMRFMVGRYGPDELFYGLSALYLALLLINLIFNSPVVYIIGIVIMFTAVGRSLSKNRAKRAKENRRYLELTAPVREKVKRYMARREQSADYFFKKCPSCKKTLRFPRVAGKHKAVCPNCKNAFEFTIKGGK